MHTCFIIFFILCLSGWTFGGNRHLVAGFIFAQHGPCPSGAYDKGAALGYCLYKFMIKMGLKIYFKKANNKNAVAYGEGMFCWVLSLVSMLTVQSKIFHFLF